MKFTLESFTKAKCTNVNFRPEKHGDRDVMAVDISVNFDLSNTALDMFHPQLRQRLYFSQADDNGQGDIDGVDKVLPNFLFPHMKLPLGWEEKMSGVVLEIDYGLGEDAGANIFLETCKLGKWRITPKEGGTVNFACQFQNSSDALDTDMCGKLSGLTLAPYIELRVTPPTLEVEQQQARREEEDIDPDAPDGPLFPDRGPADPQPTAGDIFAATEPAASTIPVKVKRSRKLGTDAEQAARQAATLAKDDAAKAAGAAVH